MDSVSDIGEGVGVVEGAVSEVASVVEEWKKIKDYPKYEVSSLGRVRRFKTNGFTIFIGTKECDGYIRIGLTKDGKCTKYKMHRLVAFAFIPNPSPDTKIEVNHLGDKDDNRVCMLEWVTPQENSIHGAVNNRKSKILAINKINPETNEVIKLYKSLAEIQNDGFTMKKIALCIEGKNKTHLNFKWENAEDKKDENIDTYKDEIWKDLKDSIFDEVNKFVKYKVSNYGRVKGHNGKIIYSKSFSNTYRISLRQDSINKYMRAHRLVLMAFNIPRPEGKDEVDHIDSNPLNNKLSNLQWANRQMQVDNVNSKVKKTIKIKAIYNNEETIYDGVKELAKKLKITINKIYKCIADNTIFKGYKFEIIDDDNMRTEKCKERIHKLKTRERDINLSKIKVTYNNESKIYIGINKLSKEIKIACAIIIKYSLLKEPYKGYIFEVLKTDEEQNKIILEKIKSSKKEKNITTIKVINTITNEETIYRGLTNLAKEIHINSSIINRTANSGEIYKGYKFEIISTKSFN